MITLTPTFSNGTGVVTNDRTTAAIPVVSGTGIFVTAPPVVGPVTYTLTVTNSAGLAATSTITVTVVAPPVVTSFAGISNGPFTHTYTLTAVFSGGSGVVRSNVTLTAHSVTSGAPFSASVPATTTFTLTVTNAVGTVATAVFVAPFLP